MAPDIYQLKSLVSVLAVCRYSGMSILKTIAPATMYRTIEGPVSKSIYAMSISAIMSIYTDRALREKISLPVLVLRPLKVSRAKTVVTINSLVEEPKVGTGEVEFVFFWRASIKGER